ncbi:hypothetical protein CFP65_4355 [Kitasatospora sp. MMS16-BH015]|uniref:hypothetical protein n=1 Tax=Kitasatospora sp. MMS16-BH015 TaxID=2018025 RepID=UPI000CA2E861|nr:hypothetical protein [Kitasatospora sp. MMS16-BH015]AUG79105.1 hypothetical protein CFP65_4355 [Kitasatospora sp. MMS16-BH015]
MSISHPSGKAAERLRPLGRIPGDGAFSVADLHQLDEAVRDARLASTASATALLAPVVADGDATSLTERSCVFDHCGVLLFPRTLEAGLRELERLGLAPLPAVPSTVVRRRLIERYGLEPADCEVHLTRLHLDLPDGRRHGAVEVFLFPRDSRAFHPRIEESEVAHGFEQHTAFVVTEPSPPLLAALVAAWRTEAGLLREGGGHNPHEGGPQGSTVMYFVRGHERPARRRRFELHCAGDLREFTERLPVETEAVGRAYTAWRPARPDIPA